MQGTLGKRQYSNIPPKIHNLITLVDRTKLELAEADKEFLSQMNQFQLQGRYPDYTQQLYKTYKAVQTKTILDKVNSIRKCLLNNL